MTVAETSLVLGPTGRLGRAVVEAGPGCAVLERTPGQDYFAEAADWVLTHRPRLVINCTGYTEVDRAQDEPAAAREVNALGPERVARACDRAGARLVHMSTDFVFDGQSTRPYREDDPARPLSAYGRSKLEGEDLVRAACGDTLVVRSAWLFGPGRPGFVEKVLALAAGGGELRVVSDQVGSPTYTRDLAAGLWHLAGMGVTGVLHLANAGQASRFELARQALVISGHDPERVRPIATSDLPGLAPRPAYAVLDCRRAARLLGGPQPTWLEGLRRYISSHKELDS